MKDEEQAWAEAYERERQLADAGIQLGFGSHDHVSKSHGAQTHDRGLRIPVCTKDESHSKLIEVLVQVAGGERVVGMMQDRFEQGLTFGQIADKYSVARSTAQSRIKSGCRKLADYNSLPRNWPATGTGGY